MEGLEARSRTVTAAGWVVPCIAQLHNARRSSRPLSSPNDRPTMIGPHLRAPDS